MKKTVTEASIKLESLLKIQRDCCSPRDSSYEYMYGMLNGMILSHAVMNDIEPKYAMSERRRKAKNNIRHKGNR
jgi:hypothetical protein